MKKKIFALFVVFAFVLNGIGTVFADTKPKKKTKRQATQLAALLPASEGVLTLNVQRFFNEALPQILSGNQPMLNGILGKIDEIKNKTGIDLRQFEQIAVGVQSQQISPTEIGFEPIVLARGSFNAGALVAVAKVASKGKYREEKIGGKTVYVFTMKELVEKDKSQTKPTVKNSIFDKAINKMFAGLSRELAVTVYDNNTLAIGSLARVRETFDTKTRISNEILDLVSRKPNAVISFGANLPSGLSKFVDLDNDELGKNIDAIRQMSGAMDVTDGNAAVSVMAKTLKPDQAQGLQETLEGLQIVGKALLGGSKGVDKKVYGRMVDNAKISRNGNEVMLDLQIPNSDINILISEKK